MRQSASMGHAVNFPRAEQPRQELWSCLQVGHVHRPWGSEDHTSRRKSRKEGRLENAGFGQRVPVKIGCLVLPVARRRRHLASPSLASVWSPGPPWWRERSCGPHAVPTTVETIVKWVFEGWAWWHTPKSLLSGGRGRNLGQPDPQTTQ